MTAPTIPASARRWLRWACALCAAALLGSGARADDQAVEATTNRLIGTVSAGLERLYKANRIGDQAALEALIRTEVLPAIDRERLTRRVFRQYWAQVEQAGRAADAQERVLQSLVRTYAVALSGYSGDKLSLVNVVPRDKGFIAKTRLRRPNGATIQIDFNFAQVGDRWLINDMAVDGIVVSLTLFNAIKPIIEQQGLDAALDSLAQVDVNRQGAEQSGGQAGGGRRAP